ncbi:MAG: class I SAM-dependent methyltransferase [Actinomycetota bacterium]|nr:class I SAM-dependent methyltransferase [Actinomycetota bacterium]
MELSEAKQMAKATWAAGEYDEVVEKIWVVGADLVKRVGVQAADSVLDVACGTGNATIPAALAGARVTGLDLTPKLLEAGKARAAAAGVEIEWVEGDAEDLPFDDESFDVVLSTFGCMFAPDHARAAAELARVLRPGGKLGVAAWTPDGSIGRFFKLASSFAPAPPPPGFQPPPLWGTRDHVTSLFNGTGVEVRFEDAAMEFSYESLDEVRTDFLPKFGPMVMLRAALEPEGRWEEAADAIVALDEELNTATDGTLRYPGEYLVTLGTKS